MPQEQVIDIVYHMLTLILKISIAPLLTALVIGILVSLLQAVTQIQEPTLTFVPKMIALFVCIILGMPFFLKLLSEYTEHLFSLIAQAT